MATYRQIVTAMVSYSSALRDLCGDEVYREFFCEPNSSPCELGVAEQPPVSAAASSCAGVLNEADVNSLLPDALKQFEDKATNQLLRRNMKTHV